MISRFPMPRVLAASIAMGLSVSAGVSQLAIAAAPQLHPDAGARSAENVQRYIVRFAEPSLAAHNRAVRTDQSKALGGVGLIPMRLKANGRMHLDTQSAEAKVYLGQLAERQNAHLSEISAAIGRDVTALRSYRHALNGAVIELTQQEAFATGRLAGIASIVPDRSHELADDISTRFIGANAVWLGGPAADRYPGYSFPTLDNLFGETNAKFGFKGDGVVVGDIDTGYNSLSPSFAATDAGGYTIKNPLGTGKFVGDCNVQGISLAGCNDKVIGVYDEINEQYYGKPGVSVEDTQGHGSHTASTIVGNARTAGFPGFSANISGIAPHANLIVYYACAPAPVNCPDSATAGAVEQAVADGLVDVLNFSISGGGRPWNDPTSQAFLDAADAGIFIAAAAGNTGTSVPQPLPGTVNHLEPWVTTVAATTLPGGVAPLVLSLTGPGTPPATTQNIAAVEGTYDTPLTAALPGTTKIVLSPTYDIGDLGSTSAPSHGTDGCSAYPADTFKNAVALISRGTCGFAVKVPNAIAAGAIAVVIADNRSEGGFSPTVGPPVVSVPVYSVSQSAGSALGTYLAANKNAGTASLGYSSTRLASTADALATFSLIGPAVGVETIKPDVAAPGVAVLAAVANDGSKNGPNLVAFYDGTSMATPHITGVGALLAGLHPDWTPQEIKSAIMMTAQQSGVTKANAVTAAGNFDVGSGRVRAFEASKAGLVLSETTDNFWNAYPDFGGDPTALNIASLQNSNCAVSCEFTRTLRSTSKSTMTWNVGVTGELASSVSVTPATFTIQPGKTVDLTIDVDTSRLNPNSGFHFANIALGAQSDSLAPGAPDLHIPLAVAVPAAQFTSATNVVNIALNGKSTGSAKLAVANPGAGVITYRPLATGNQSFVWIDQANEHYYGFYSTHYTDLGPKNTDFYVADDFTISGKDPVNLASIVTPGFTSNHTLASFGASLPLHWRIYADNKGLPSSDPDTGGAAVWSYDSTAGAPGVKVAGDTISLDLTAAKQSTALPAGKYWLVVYPDLPCKDTKNSGSCAEGWIWANSWKGSGALWASIAPQTKFNTWDNTPANNAPYGLGLAMTLTAAVPCTLPSWLSMSPANGILTSASSGNITFAANFPTGTPAAGAPPQTAYVCIASSTQDALGTDIPKSVAPIQVNAK